MPFESTTFLAQTRARADLMGFYRAGKARASNGTLDETFTPHAELTMSSVAVIAAIFHRTSS